jgi:aminoglycoside phosphotransferase (APT) family kinase protein
MSTTLELEPQIGEDLLAAVRALGLSLASVTLAAGEGYPGYQPTAYRLATADGRVLKGRLLDSPAVAERAEYVARCLPGVVPAPLMRSGRALVTEWVDGWRPDGAGCSAAMLRQCGGLQAAVHLVPIPAPERRPGTRRMAWRSERLREGVAALSAGGAFAADEATRLIDMALRHAPEHTSKGFTLGDFCPENIIVGGSGEVFFIDHEGLAIDECDYDLARTWYRWAMTAEQRAAFFAGYAQQRSLEPFRSHFPYWAITALVAAAVFRRLRHADAAAAPIDRLRRLLAELARGASPADGMYLS